MVEFKEGDVVQLKSGGPKMTIKDIGDYSMGTGILSAKCVWFDGKKQCTSVFPLHTLEKT
jgi:uncharacterized protein YodC (DUF2158 family)